MNAISTHLIGHKMNIKNILREQTIKATEEQKTAKWRVAIARRIFVFEIINLLTFPWKSSWLRCDQYISANELVFSHSLPIFFLSKRMDGFETKQRRESFEREMHNEQIKRKRK